jgi:hypothetical protein
VVAGWKQSTGMEMEKSGGDGEYGGSKSRNCKREKVGVGFGMAMSMRLWSDGSSKGTGAYPWRDDGGMRPRYGLGIHKIPARQSP